MTGSMDGKVALVTGAGSGIGREAAILLARRGARVLVADLDEASGKTTVQLIEAAGGTAVFLLTDVTREDDARNLVEEAVRQFDRLDYALNNAGSDGDILPLEEQKREKFLRVLDVNLMGVFYGMKYQLPVMAAKGGGAIVNTSSIAGLRGHPGLGPYVAAKHAVNGLTKTAALEYAGKGVRVNALCPGGVRTAMLEEYLRSAPELKARIIDDHPMKRMGEAREMAEAAAWLLSDAAS